MARLGAGSCRLEFDIGGNEKSQAAEAAWLCLTFDARRPEGLRPRIELLRLLLAAEFGFFFLLVGQDVDHGLGEGCGAVAEFLFGVSEALLLFRS
jgi:hypothetical protein